MLLECVGRGHCHGMCDGRVRGGGLFELGLISEVRGSHEGALS